MLAGVPCDTVTVAINPIEMALPCGDMSLREVPGRNLIFLAHAARVAANAGLVCPIWFGAIRDDSPYSDCRATFVSAASTVLMLSTGHLVSAPLVAMDKEQVVREAWRLSVPIDECWSCYAPVNGAPCAACASCVSRVNALLARKGE